MVRVFLLSILGLLIMTWASTPLPRPTEFSESPVLREKVEQGLLPPLEERLPAEPFVVGPGTLVYEGDLEWAAGQYGGVLRGVTWMPDQDFDVRDANMQHFLSTPKFKTGPIQGDLVSHFEVSEDLTTFTLTLRQGLRWSDGEFVTTEDVRFTVEDVLKNPVLTPVFPTMFRTGGRPEGSPLELEIVDRYTFRFRFDGPYGRFVRHLGVGQMWGGYTWLLKPSHFLKRFHADYTPVEEMADALRAQGFGLDEWHRLFLLKDITWGETPSRHAVGFPKLNPWVRVESPPDLIIMERNPFFHQVDIEGRQLPYVDRYESTIVADLETVPMVVFAGAANWVRKAISLDMAPLLIEQQERVGYRVHMDLVKHNAPIALFFNYNYPDPAWQEVTWDRRFRQAVNMAIDREELLDAVWFGLGTTSPWIPADFNPAEAERILDEMGLNRRDAEGWRLGPDGRRFEIHLEFVTGPGWVRTAELLAANLEAVGLRTPMRLIAPDLWMERRAANQLKASIDWLDDVNWPFLMFYDYMPNSRIWWGLEWHRWLETGGELGQMPPDWIKELYDIDTRLAKVLPGTPGAEEALDDFTAWYWENIPMFPLARDVVTPVVISPDMGNVAHSGFAAATQFASEQVFFRSPE